MADEELKRVAEARLGRVLKGKYRLDRVLGIGGMATVYAATHRNKKRVAIKMLHPELSTRESLRARFLREGYVANSVDHPGAVSVHDDDVAEDGSAFLVMELLEGSAVDTLAAASAGRTLPLGLVLSIGDALLDVLVAAHAMGIVHRDLKPANLFLTNDGRLEVLDFGIARLHDETASTATATGAVLGTPAFMAPEQAMGEQEKVDAQTDVWAVGATLFVLLAGTLVHDGVNAQQLMIAAATMKARSLASVVEAVPKAIADVIDRALAFERTERWASATEMREALRRACLEATGAPVAALPKTERVERGSGLGDVASSQDVATGSSEIGFDPTKAAESSATGPGAEPGANGAATGGALSATRPGEVVPAPRARSARAALVVVAVLVGSLVCAVWVRRASSPEAGAGAPASSSSAAVQPRPGKPPANPAAASAYEVAMSQLRDGRFDEAMRSFQAASAGDPSFGAAHLRYAILDGDEKMNDEKERAAYQKALEQRATLGDLDTAILAAWEPRFRTPPDREERYKRMLGVANGFPNDPFIQYLLGNAAGWLEEHLDVAYAAYERALAIDPHYIAAYGGMIDLANDRGDVGRGVVAAERCLKVAPSAIWCLQARLENSSNEGRCEDAAIDARAKIKADPSTKEYHLQLASVLTALGEPPDAVGEVLKGASSHLTDADERRDWGLASTALIAELAGDLDTADKALGEEIAWASAHPALDALRSSFEQVQVALEEDDAPRARKLLKALHGRILAKETGDWTDVLATAPFKFAEVRAGAITHEQLRAWQEPLVRSVADVPWVAWAAFYKEASDAIEANDALATEARYGKMPDSALHDAYRAGNLGKLYALAGRGADAVPLLRRATRACFPLRNVMRSTYAWYWLGVALEQTGDTAGAADAYGKVLARWGQAKPRSVLADQARAAVARLAKKK